MRKLNCCHKHIDIIAYISYHYGNIFSRRYGHVHKIPRSPARVLLHSNGFPVRWVWSNDKSLPAHERCDRGAAHAVQPLGYTRDFSNQLFAVSHVRTPRGATPRYPAYLRAIPRTVQHSRSSAVARARAADRIVRRDLRASRGSSSLRGNLHAAGIVKPRCEHRAPRPIGGQSDIPLRSRDGP